jgi:hypothetical protein
MNKIKRTTVLVIATFVIMNSSVFAGDKEDALAAKIAYLREHLKVLELDYTQTAQALKQLDPKAFEQPAPEPKKEDKK